jgi:DNA-binding MarR family transcriptional regulator
MNSIDASAQRRPAVSVGTGPEGAERSRIMLGLLESVERDGEQTQRRLASELGIALGLVNAYLKRCIKKGLVKVSQAPARRYGYYLTPQGFAEKSRLTVDYLSYSFSLFRRARSDYARVLGTARERGFTRIVLAGVSDLAEIAAICAIDDGTQIVGLVDPASSQERFVALPVFASYDLVVEEFDAVVITDLRTAGDTYAEAVRRFGGERVLAPALLGLAAQAGTSERVA